MINDKTIDYNTAKFYCAFSDDDLEQQLATATSYSKTDGKRLGKIITAITTETKSLTETDWNFIQGMHQTAFPMATGNPYQPNFRALDPNSGVLSLKDQGKNNIIAAATSAALVGATTTPSVWNMLANSIASAGTTLAAYLGLKGAENTVRVGTWLITAIIGGIVTISSYLYPRIALWLKNMSRNNCIAECQFTSNNTPYKCYYSLNENKWILSYNNNRWIRSGIKVPDDDIQMFFTTQFFKKFVNKCQQYLEVIFNNKKNKEALYALAQISDKASKKQLELFLNNEVQIKNNLFLGKYITETDNYIKEDALVGNNNSIATGEITNSISSNDNDVVIKDIGIDDVIGKDCNHNKDGYMSTKCFHIPSNVLGKKYVLKHNKTLLKKKKYKNLYKNIKI